MHIFSQNYIKSVQCKISEYLKAESHPYFENRGTLKHLSLLTCYQDESLGTEYGQLLIWLALNCTDKHVQIQSHLLQSYITNLSGYQFKLNLLKRKKLEHYFSVKPQGILTDLAHLKCHKTNSHSTIETQGSYSLALSYFLET